MTQNTAALYRMVLPTHTCPYGVRARELLEEANFEIDEHILASREEVEAFKSERGVDTTPQILIGEKWIDGSEELECYLERVSS